MSPTTLQEQAREHLMTLEIPSPSGGRRVQEIDVHQIRGASGEPLLAAFGTIGLKTWLEVVNTYHADVLDRPEPWNPEDPDRVVDALDRLGYGRVLLEDGSDPAEVRWDEGVVPITYWRLDPAEDEG